MKPYTNREALEDPLSRLFNARLSALRTVMSENVCARWKNMFPVLRMHHSHYGNAKVIVTATAILHNIAIKFGEVCMGGLFRNSTLAIMLGGSCLNIWVVYVLTIFPHETSLQVVLKNRLFSASLMNFSPRAPIHIQIDC
jgi:hypothetical protein